MYTYYKNGVEFVTPIKQLVMKNSRESFYKDIYILIPDSRWHRVLKLSRLIKNL